MHRCPLCQDTASRTFFEDKRASYYQCTVCELVFINPDNRPSADEEKKRYGEHQNNPANSDYRNFLLKFATPLIERLGKKPLKGLDFGSGPGPALSLILEESGFDMEIYDPFFAPDRSVLDGQYDFITCTETIEHFHDPAKEWKLLISLLKPGGILGFMTSLIDDVSNFGNWYYKNDPTHVCFFSRNTFLYLAHRENLPVEFVGKNIIFFSPNISRVHR